MRRARVIALAVVGAAVLVLLGSMIAGLTGLGRDRRPARKGEGRAVPERVRVEVLNAAGVPGLARTATERLRDHGFDVVFYGNARGFGRDTSMVLDRVGEGQHPHEIARVLEIGRVISRPDTTLYLEATVVIGRDWTGARVDSTAR